MDPNQFFLWHIDPLSLIGKTMVLLLSVFLGGCIGFERELRGQAAGLRTHILVCVGSTLLTLVSVEIGMGVGGTRTGDPARLAAQIVTGIGFLGAGAIVREGMTIHGLTTAASVWITAAIGIALGSNPHMGETALVAAAIVLATLTLVNRFEDVLKLKHPIRRLEVAVQTTSSSPAKVLVQLAEHGLTVYGINLEEETRDKQQITHIHMRVQLPKGFERSQFNGWMAEIEGIVSFQLD